MGFVLIVGVFEEMGVWNGIEWEFLVDDMLIGVGVGGVDLCIINVLELINL